MCEVVPRGPKGQVMIPPHQGVRAMFGRIDGNAVRKRSAHAPSQLGGIPDVAPVARERRVEQG